MRRTIALLLVLIGLITSSIFAQDNFIPPPPQKWITDQAYILKPTTIHNINNYLIRYNHETGHQVLIWIGTNTNGIPIEDWTIKTFANWKVGNKKLDDGLVLFLFTEDRKIRIEVGYGLEDKIPDAKANAIIYETIIPQLKNGNPDEAISQGIQSIVNTLGYTNKTNHTPKKKNYRIQSLTMILAGILLLVLIIINPNLAIWILLNILLSGRAGNNDNDNDRYNGGGGRSGGGGASGSW